MTQPGGNEVRPRLLAGLPALLLAAGVSVVGYLGAFAYEAGLTGTLDLPVSLISPQLPATVLAAASLFITASLVVIGLEIVAAIIRRIKDPVIGWVAYELLPFALFGLANAAFYQEYWREWAWTFLPLAAVATIELLVVPLTLHRRISGYRAKLLAEQETPWTGALAFTPVATRLGRGPFAVLLFVLLFLYFAYVIGRSAGLSEATYVVTNDSKPTVVVRIYGDSVVTETYDPRTMRPNLDFSIRSARTSGLILTTKTIGHLATDCDVAIGCHSPSDQYGLP